MSRVEISTSDDSGWVRHGEGLARGRAFEGDRTDGLLDAASIAERGATCTTTAEFEQLLSRLAGFYAVVVHPDGERGEGPILLAGADRMQTTPLFYGRGADTLYLSDSASTVRAAVGDGTLDDTAREEYLRTTFVTGRDTLSPDVKQVRPGEMLIVEDSGGSLEVRTERHYRHTPTEEATWNSTDPQERYADALSTAIHRLVTVADGRTIALSLSGGHDSRLLALLLQEMGYDDVVAFTYTAPEMEVQRAKTAAEELGLDWRFVEFSHEEVASWYRSDEYDQYLEAAGHLSAVPNPWLPVCVRKLVTQGKLPPDALVVTGDGALSMGEHVPTSLVEGDWIPRARLTEELYSFNYTEYERTDPKLTDRVKARILESLDEPVPETVEPETAARLFEEWDWQERESKRISSGYVYEWFDLDWWTPLFDDALLDFWCTTPLDLRVDKRLHREFVERRYAEKTGTSASSASFSLESPLIRLVDGLVSDVPVVETVARQVYGKLNPPRFPYEEMPELGMITRGRYDELTDEGRVSLSPKHLHALQIVEHLSLEGSRR